MSSPPFTSDLCLIFVQARITYLVIIINNMINDNTRLEFGIEKFRSGAGGERAGQEESAHGRIKYLKIRFSI